MRCIALALVGACWRSAPPPPPIENKPPVARAHPDARPAREVDVYIDRMEAFADQFCGCRDPACAQRIADDLTKWAQEIAKDQPKFDDSDQKRMMEISQRMGECMQKAMAGSATP